MTVKQEANVHLIRGKNFSAANVGKFADLDNYKLDVPRLQRTITGKLFAKEILGFTSMQISMNKFPPGVRVPFSHQHKQNEEAYIIIAGKGQMQIDDQTFDVEEGSIVRVGIQGGRCIRNNSDQPLYYICIQAKENSLDIDTFDDGIPGDKKVIWPD